MAREGVNIGILFFRKDNLTMIRQLTVHDDRLIVPRGELRVVYCLSICRTVSASRNERFRGQ